MKQQYAIVTGVASGLGAAFLNEIVEQGNKVFGVDINADAIPQLESMYPSCFFMAADVRDPELFDRIYLKLSEQGDQISDLFLVAGIGKKTDFLSQHDHDIQQQFEVNVFARLTLLRKYAQLKIAQQVPGSVLVVSSSSALQPLVGFSAYCAANSALLSFSRSIAMELTRFGISVYALIPGGMDTNFQQQAGVRRLKHEKLLSPNYVAKKALKLMNKPSGVTVIGRNAIVMNLSMRLLPVRITDKIWRFLTLRAR